VDPAGIRSGARRSQLHGLWSVVDRIKELSVSIVPGSRDLQYHGHNSGQSFLRNQHG
jgi:hypothetical protein